MVEIALYVAATALIGSTSLNVWLFTRSNARRVELVAQRALDYAKTAHQVCEGVELRVNGWKVELDNINEQVADALSQAERKRNRAETADRRAEARQVVQPQPAELSRADLLAPYRALLHQ